MNPRSILILLAHPRLHRSRVNRALAEAARGVDGVTLVDLYHAFPDFEIDVPGQQRLLVEHDVIVFQHPLFWYSSPAILKEWQDLVLQYGFAYGSDSGALEGKAAMSAVTTGGVEGAYRHGGHNNFELVELLRPFEQTFRFCGMKRLPTHVVHGTHNLREHEIAERAAGYARCLETLVDPATDLDALPGPYLQTPAP